MAANREAVCGAKRTTSTRQPISPASIAASAAIATGMPSCGSLMVHWRGFLAGLVRRAAIASMFSGST